MADISFCVLFLSPLLVWNRTRKDLWKRHLTSPNTITSHYIGNTVHWHLSILYNVCIEHKNKVETALFCIWSKLRGLQTREVEKAYQKLRNMLVNTYKYFFILEEINPYSQRKVDASANTSRLRMCDKGGCTLLWIRHSLRVSLYINQPRTP